MDLARHRTACRRLSSPRRRLFTSSVYRRFQIAVSEKCARTHLQVLALGAAARVLLVCRPIHYPCRCDRFMPGRPRVQIMCDVRLALHRPDYDGGAVEPDRQLVARGCRLQKPLLVVLHHHSSFNISSLRVNVRPHAPHSLRLVAAWLPTALLYVITMWPPKCETLLQIEHLRSFRRPGFNSLRAVQMPSIVLQLRR